MHPDEHEQVALELETQATIDRVETYELNNAIKQQREHTKGMLSD